MAIVAPSIRVNKIKPNRKKRIVAKLLSKYGNKCCFCQKPMKFNAPQNDPKTISIEHVIRRAEGGTNAIKNLKLAHRDCNMTAKYEKEPFKTCYG